MAFSGPTPPATSRPAGSSGAPRNWLKPATWHLRTRLTALAMALLITICGAVGVVSYASMDTFLTRQLDDQLTQAAERSNDPGRPPMGGFNGRDPLDARGQSVGTLNARIVDGQVSSAGFLAPDTTRSALSAKDKETLQALAAGSAPVDRKLSTGNYRLVAVQTSFDDVLVTGLPLAAKESTLASLVWTFLFVSLGGLLLVGFAGTVLIRRTMKPLEQLSGVATRVSRLPLDAGEVALAVRVPPSNANPGTEVGSVGHALNLMLDHVANALQARQRSETKVRQFVADASHELRTPLTAIRGYTELLRMTEHFTPEGERSLARVQSQSERMTALVEDLLLLARLDEGQPLKLADVDLTQLVIEGVSDEKVMAPGHNWRLELPEEPVVVAGDAAQLRQVLMNLLSNARKHTPAGTTVETRVRVVPGGAAEVAVTDDGGGIPPEFVDKVFARFARADAARKGASDRSGPAAAEGTSGLGLSIVQSIVEAHGGTVSVESRPGRTSFIVRLPITSG
ncbi:sensor histidine kinase [Pseudarthrobacter sp. NPDC092424]|uniref:sensor histidine kinase n=1 Tax=Pseudarthrobacter sp. NPDC092424 TaxID=3364415 RepID=UPI0037F648D9